MKRSSCDKCQVPPLFFQKRRGDVSGTLLSTIKDSSESKEVLLCAGEICYGLCDHATENRTSTEIWQTSTFLVRACFLHHGFTERIKPGLRRPGSTCNPTVYWQHDLGQITFPSVPISSSAKQVQSLCPPLTQNGEVNTGKQAEALWNPQSNTNVNNHSVVNIGKGLETTL